MKTLGFDSNNNEVGKILDKINSKKGPLKYEDFMDVMLEKESEKEPEGEIKKAFKVLCEEGMDKITMKSLSKICVDLGEKIGEDELQEMIGQNGKEQDEEISEDDFMDVMVEKEDEKESEGELRKAFKILCEEGMDKITIKSLSKICVDLGEKIGEEELQEMISEADKDQDEEIGEEDFVKIMKKIGMF